MAKGKLNKHTQRISELVTEQLNTQIDGYLIIECRRNVSRYLFLGKKCIFCKIRFGIEYFGKN